MSKIYCTFNLFGQKWKVIVTEALEPSVNGLCIFEKRTIKVRKSLSPELFKHVLLHEFFHAALFRSSFYVSGIPAEFEELMIDQLSKMMIENSRTLRRLKIF